MRGVEARRILLRRHTIDRLRHNLPIAPADTPRYRLSDVKVCVVNVHIAVHRSTCAVLRKIYNATNVQYQFKTITVFFVNAVYILDGISIKRRAERGGKQVLHTLWKRTCCWPATKGSSTSTGDEYKAVEGYRCAYVRTWPLLPEISHQGLCAGPLQYRFFREGVPAVRSRSSCCILLIITFLVY